MAALLHQSASWARALGISRALRKPVNAPPPKVARWRGARVLVVEDNAVNQRVARGLLEPRGIEVIVASHGREAVELLTGPTLPFDLVLMDMEMPEMDGLDATRRIRALETSRGGAPRVPIVAVTAHALAEVSERCVEAGMDRCITKPLRGQDLDDVLGRHLRGTWPDDAGQLRDMLGIVDGDRELLAVAAREYLAQTPGLLAGLREAVGLGDAPEVARLAHKMKGSSLQLAGTAVGAAAGALETAASGGDLARAGPLLDEVESETRGFTLVVRSAAGEPP